MKNNFVYSLDDDENSPAFFCRIFIKMIIIIIFREFFCQQQSELLWSEPHRAAVKSLNGIWSSHSRTHKMCKMCTNLGILLLYSILIAATVLCLSFFLSRSTFIMNTWMNNKCHVPHRSFTICLSYAHLLPYQVHTCRTRQSIGANNWATLRFDIIQF